MKPEDMTSSNLIKAVEKLGYAVEVDPNNSRAFVEVNGQKNYLILCRGGKNYSIQRSYVQENNEIPSLQFSESEMHYFDDSKVYIGFVTEHEELQKYVKNKNGNTDGWSVFNQQAVEAGELDGAIDFLEGGYDRLLLEEAKKLKAVIEKEKQDEIKNPKGWSNFSKFSEEIKKKYPRAQVTLPADTQEGMHRWRKTHGEQQLHVTVNGITLTFYQHKNQVNLNDYEFNFIPRGDNTVDQLSQADKTGKKAYLVEQKLGSEVPAKMVIFDEKGESREINIGHQFLEKPEVKQALKEVKEQIGQAVNLICPLNGKSLELVRDYAVLHDKRELRVSFHIGLDPTKKESDQQKDKNDRIKRSIDSFVDMIQQSPEFKDKDGKPIRNIIITHINPEDLRDQLMGALKEKRMHIFYEGKIWKEDKNNRGKFVPKESKGEKAGVGSGQGSKISENRNTLLSSQRGSEQKTVSGNQSLPAAPAV